MGRIIPKSFIDELMARTDIVNIIKARVSLEKSGCNYKTCCPFHEEKTPSFTVDHPSQTYHCFGCGRSGNVIIFLMEYEHINFIEAIKILAAHACMEIPCTATETKSVELETILYFDGSGLDVPGNFLEIAQLLQHMTRKERTLGFVMELLHSQFKVKERIKEDK